MPQTYIEPLGNGHYEFGIVIRRDGGEYRIKKGDAVRREDAEHLLEHLDDLDDWKGR